MNVLGRVKPLDDLLASSGADQAGTALKKTLGVWGLTALGIGAIIGTGIFVLTGHAAATQAGPAIVLSFVVAGIVSALAALCYAELASSVPVSGSAYTYVYTTASSSRCRATVCCPARSRASTRAFARRTCRRR